MSDNPKRERWNGQIDELPYDTEDFDGGEKVELTYEDLDGNEQTFRGEFAEYASHNSWLLIFGEDQSAEIRTPDFTVRYDGVVLIEPYMEGDLFPVGHCVSVEAVGDDSQMRLTDGGTDLGGNSEQ